jgi:ferredoxin
MHAREGTRKDGIDLEEECSEKSLCSGCRIEVQGMAAKGQAYWPLESEILFLKNKHVNADQVAAEIVELGAVGRKSRKGSL